MSTSFRQSAETAGSGPAQKTANEALAGRSPVTEFGRVPPLHQAAARAAHEHSDQLIKPLGALGRLETLIERWALRTGAPPPAELHAGILLCGADHGHVVHRTSPYPQAVTTQMMAAVVSGASAISVLARQGNHALLSADIGLIGPTPEGVRDFKVAPGTADFTTEPAMSPAQLEAALAAGATLTDELVREQRIDCLVLGEVGIGNTTTAAALACEMLDIVPEQAVGLGTGMDAAGLERKRGAVAQALALHGPGLRGLAAMQMVGGFELAALSGATLAAARHELPVVLDGYPASVAALAAVQDDPAVADALFAGHRSAEPGHSLVLSELGLEPLIDVQMRIGEGTGAAMALPLIAAAGALHRDMGTFAQMGVSGSL